MCGAESLVLRWLHINSCRYWYVCRHRCRQRCLGHRYILLYLYNVLNRVFEFIPYIPWDFLRRAQFSGFFSQMERCRNTSLFPRAGAKVPV